jgi:hypothetical protein
VSGEAFSTHERCGFVQGNPKVAIETGPTPRGGRWKLWSFLFWRPVLRDSFPIFIEVHPRSEADRAENSGYYSLIKGENYHVI